MAAANHVIYDNFFLSNEIEDQFNTAIDLQQYFTVDNTLTEGPGMVKYVNVYSASDATEILGMGEGNTKSIEVTYDAKEYRVQLAQTQFDYYDEQAMTDPMVVPTGVRRMSSGIFNQVDADFMVEMKKATRTITAEAWDADLFADAEGLLTVDGTDNAPEDMRPFAFVNPKDIAVLRKSAGESLQYVEAFKRQGYIGTLYGVDIISKKNQVIGETEVSLPKAVTLFNKLGTEVEQARNASPDDVGNTRHNYMWARKYYVIALTDDTKIVKIKVGGDEPVVEPSISLDKSTLSVAESATADLVATVVPDDAEVTWDSSDKTVATVSDGTVTGVAAGTATISAAITVDGVEYKATCAVTVTAAG